jgi:hypothetical protein
MCAKGIFQGSVTSSAPVAAYFSAPQVMVSPVNTISNLPPYTATGATVSSDRTDGVFVAPTEMAWRKERAGNSHTALSGKKYAYHWGFRDVVEMRVDDTLPMGYGEGAATYINSLWANNDTVIVQNTRRYSDTASGKITNASMPIGTRQVAGLDEPQIGGWNLFQYSEQFDQAPPWLKTRSAIVADYATAPDGTMTADKMVCSSALSTHVFQDAAVQIRPGYAANVSIHAKADEHTTFQLRIFDTASSGLLLLQGYNVASATVISSQGSAEFQAIASRIEIDREGFVRAGFGFIASVSTSINVQFYATGSGTGTSIAGTGSDGLIFWGAQLSESSDFLPYRRTTGEQLFAPMVYDARKSIPYVNLSGTIKLESF